MEREGLISNCHSIRESCALLRQGMLLLEELTDDLYTGCQPPYFTHSVGSHFRHVIDFYLCFLTGRDQGLIDYDHRVRDPHLASNRDLALLTLAALVGRLEQLTEAADMPLLVRLEADPSSVADLTETSSSLGRELQFLLSHTVHHYALIALLLRLQGFAPPPEFGVAPSTLQYWRQPN